MKKRVVIIVACLFILILAFFGSTSKKGTIIAFVDNAVVIALKDGKTVTRFENYHIYIPTGEQWSVGDTVKIKYTGILREISMHRVIK